MEPAQIWADLLKARFLSPDCKLVMTQVSLKGWFLSGCPNFMILASRCPPPQLPSIGTLWKPELPERLSALSTLTTATYLNSETTPDFPVLSHEESKWNSEKISVSRFVQYPSQGAQIPSFYLAHM